MCISFKLRNMRKAEKLSNIWKKFSTGCGKLCEKLKKCRCGKGFQRFYNVTNRVINSAFTPEINIKYTCFPHIFLHSAKVFHKSYSFAQATFGEFFTSRYCREKVYHTQIRAPQFLTAENHRKIGKEGREKQDVPRVFALSTKSAHTTATTTTKNFYLFYFFI